MTSLTVLYILLISHVWLVSLGGWRSDSRGVGGDWEERREEKLWLGCILVRFHCSLVHYRHGDHGSVQADMVPEKLRVLCLDPKAAPEDCALLGIA